MGNICDGSMMAQHKPGLAEMMSWMDLLPRCSGTPRSLKEPPKERLMSATTFPVPELQRILQRAEFYDTLKYTSGQNVAGVEVSVLPRQCLNRQIGEPNVLLAEIKTWERQNSSSGARFR
jgi:hypothetical protein